MSTFSDAVHADLAAAKNAIENFLAGAETTAETIVEDLVAAATQLIQQAGPVLIQAAVAGVNTAMTTVGTVASKAEAAETAALNTLSAVGKPILDSDVAALKVIIGTQLSTTTSPAT